MNEVFLQLFSQLFTEYFLSYEHIRAIKLIHERKKSTGIKFFFLLYDAWQKKTKNLSGVHTNTPPLDRQTDCLLPSGHQNNGNNYTYQNSRSSNNQHQHWSRKPRRRFFTCIQGRTVIIF